MYNITLKCICVNTGTMKNQGVLYILSVCL